MRWGLTTLIELQVAEKEMKLQKDKVTWSKLHKLEVIESKFKTR
jgi:hypothetical protein